MKNSYLILLLLAAVCMIFGTWSINRADFAHHFYVGVFAVLKSAACFTACVDKLLKQMKTTN